MSALDGGSRITGYLSYNPATVLVEVVLLTALLGIHIIDSFTYGQETG
jgi:hypothetical protein